MRTLYLECNMGAAGDMLMAALLEIHPEPERVLKRLQELEIPGVAIQSEWVEKCGIMGRHMKVAVHGQEEESREFHRHSPCGEYHEGHTPKHHPFSFADIEHLLAHLNIPDSVREHALAVYRLLAEAESKAHGREVCQIHFHEVGNMDAVADIVGVCLLMEELSPDVVIASPVHVGAGHVHCAHGVLPVPAPATAYLLQNIPIYGGEIQGELCTPTGAALLKHFVDKFGELPVMKVEKIGYGMGKKDFAMANCIRAMLGSQESGMDYVTELCCNLDDMTPEELGFATSLLQREGALDVYTSAIQMKKNRPGVLLTCMCRASEREKFLALLFRHTTTLGVREYTAKRYGLQREMMLRQTPFGEIHVKKSEGYGVSREKAEYEELVRLADKTGLSLREIKQTIE